MGDEKVLQEGPVLLIRDDHPTHGALLQKEPLDPCLAPQPVQYKALSAQCVRPELAIDEILVQTASETLGFSDIDHFGNTVDVVRHDIYATIRRKLVVQLLVAEPDRGESFQSPQRLRVVFMHRTADFGLLIDLTPIVR